MLGLIDLCDSILDFIKQVRGGFILQIQTAKALILIQFLKLCLNGVRAGNITLVNYLIVGVKETGVIHRLLACFHANFYHIGSRSKVVNAVLGSQAENMRGIFLVASVIVNLIITDVVDAYICDQLEDIVTGQRSIGIGLLVGSCDIEVLLFSGSQEAGDHHLVVVKTTEDIALGLLFRCFCRGVSHQILDNKAAFAHIQGQGGGQIAAAIGNDHILPFTGAGSIHRCTGQGNGRIALCGKADLLIQIGIQGNGYSICAITCIDVLQLTEAGQHSTHIAAGADHSCGQLIGIEGIQALYLQFHFTRHSRNQTKYISAIGVNEHTVPLAGLQSGYRGIILIQNDILGLCQRAGNTGACHQSGSNILAICILGGNKAEVQLDQFLRVIIPAYTDHPVCPLGRGAGYPVSTTVCISSDRGGDKGAVSAGLIHSHRGGRAQIVDHRAVANKVYIGNIGLVRTGLSLIALAYSGIQIMGTGSAGHIHFHFIPGACLHIGSCNRVAIHIVDNRLLFH